MRTRRHDKGRRTPVLLMIVFRFLGVENTETKRMMELVAIIPLPSPYFHLHDIYYSPSLFSCVTFNAWLITSLASGAGNSSLGFSIHSDCWAIP